MVAKLQHDIFHTNTYSDGYDIEQEAICFLCSYIGQKSGEICVPNIHKKLDNIRVVCFKYIYANLRKERKVIEQEDIENCIIKVDEIRLKTPEGYTRVRKIIKQLKLTQNELKNCIVFTIK